MASSNFQSPRSSTNEHPTHTVHRHARALALGLLAIILSPALPTSADDSQNSLPLVYQDEFDAGLDRWEPTDDDAWKIEADKDGRVVLRQFQQSKYQPPHRSPVNLALVKNLDLADFQLDVDVRSTARDYPHRSVCLFFGYQDPAHFYYVHLGQKTDDHANQIFIVNEAPRIKISTRTTPGTPWDSDWHHVRIIRDSSEGTIQVFFDDLDEPIMTATDATFTHGRLGLGSFDDTGDWDHLVIRGAKH